MNTMGYETRKWLNITPLSPDASVRGHLPVDWLLKLIQPNYSTAACMFYTAPKAAYSPSASRKGGSTRRYFAAH